MMLILHLQEIPHSLYESIGFFQLWTMTALSKPNPFDLPRDMAEIRLHGNVLGLIKFTVDEKGWHCDFGQERCYVPVLKGAGDVEL